MFLHNPTCFSRCRLCSRGVFYTESWLRHCDRSRKVAGSIPVGGRWVNAASNRNEYQENFLGGKDGRGVGLITLPTFMCRLFSKSGSLNLLEPSGPVQGCTGIALPLYFIHPGSFQGPNITECSKDIVYCS